MGAQTLAAGVSALGLDVCTEAQAELLRYLALIAKWNNVYNLTAIRERDHMLVEHLLDSLAILPHVQPSAVLDIGSGAGLPGIALAIARRGLQVTVLDSNRKKCAFLQQVVIELSLTNVTVACARAESYRVANAFDTVVSRALADLSTIARLSVSQLVPGGLVLALKGAVPHDELTRLPETITVRAIIRLSVPGLDAQRHLVVMTKA
jgi:16S rRNA (guanine527-N7)-methyltransferase